MLALKVNVASSLAGCAGEHCACAIPPCTLFSAYFHNIPISKNGLHNMKKGIMAALTAAAFFSGGATADNALLTTQPNLINEDIEIYDFAYGGSGCPSGSASAVMSPDYSKISMFFDQYTADSTTTDSGRVRKSCNLGVAVRVPHGLTVALVALDYRGYVDNAPGAYASLQANYFFAGESVGSRLNKEWIDPENPIVEDFLVEDNFRIGSISWSPCGEDAIIRANTSIKAYKAADGGKAEIQLDTVDASSKIEYQLQWDTCQQP
ncbi:conserved hypothetical protein [Hahella chejuensis KCTC 2396]|uniref:DUF4360 domain-containing protein n=2 Tax=Hahella chejuensis TaxID=158327 RepID=Q2SAE7_HAHCH|nr:conserved hypothetical protein [Hahella chejuensis KCTC 2396]